MGDLESREKDYDYEANHGSNHLLETNDIYSLEDSYGLGGLDTLELPVDGHNGDEQERTEYHDNGLSNIDAPGESLHDVATTLNNLNTKGKMVSDNKKTCDCSN